MTKTSGDLAGDLAEIISQAMEGYSPGVQAAALFANMASVMFDVTGDSELTAATLGPTLDAVRHIRLATAVDPEDVN